MAARRLLKPGASERGDATSCPRVPRDQAPARVRHRGQSGPETPCAWLVGWSARLPSVAHPGICLSQASSNRKPVFRHSDLHAGHARHACLSLKPLCVYELCRKPGQEKVDAQQHHLGPRLIKSRALAQAPQRP